MAPWAWFPHSSPDVVHIDVHARSLHLPNVLSDLSVQSELMVAHRKQLHAGEFGGTLNWSSSIASPTSRVLWPLH